MEVLHISLKQLEGNDIELRYWKEREANYEDKRLQISEIEDLISLCQRDYYALRPQLSSIGQRLYRWLDGEGRWLTRAIADCEAEGIVLAIAPTQKLAHLPWEVLHDGQEFLVAKDYPLVAPVRWVNKPMEPLPVQSRSLQVLFMATSPENVKPVLDFEKEESEILRITQSYPLTLRVEESGCVGELKKRWKDTFDIFHLTGHANINTEEPYEPYFITETLTGDRCSTNPNQLRQAFGAKRPRLIFLSGCRTGESGNNGSVPSFAESLIDKGMPAVMGWGRPVLDTTATKCAATLYERLAAGDAIAQALSLTFHALIQDEDVTDWHLLRLYVRGESWGPIVDEPGFYVQSEPIQQQFLDKAGLVRVATPEQYVGRRRLLQRGLRSLKSPQFFGLMLHGMGGLGKSSTAARLIERSPGYQPIVFYQGIDAAKLERTLNQQCLSEQGLKILRGNLPLTQKLTAFFDQGLNDANQRFMFVLDDFEANLDIESRDQAVLKDEAVDCLNALLQALKQCKTPHRILITSRYDVRFPICNESIQRLPLTALKDADLRKKCDRLAGFQTEGQRSEQQLKAIAIADGNPRLLEWLDKILLDQSLDSEQILEQLEKTQIEFREDILAEQLLSQQNQEVQTLLTRMQVFELPVPLEAIVAICPEIDQLDDRCQRAAALGLLECDGLVNLTYRLPQIFIPLLARATDMSGYAKAVDVLYQQWWEQTERTEEKALELIRLAALTEEHEIEDTVARNLGDLWHKQGRYRDCIDRWQSILALRKKQYGNKHYSVATSLNNLADLYRRQSKYKEAECLFKESIEINKQLFGGEHLHIATNFQQLGLLYLDQGDYKKSKQFLKRAYDIGISLFGEEHLFVAHCLNGLASLYRKQEEYDIAEANYLKVLKLLKKFDNQEAEMAIISNNLGSIYENIQQYKKAEKFLNEAYLICKSLYGDEHPLMIKILTNLASLNNSLNREELSEELYRSALETASKLLGEKHIDVCKIQNNLAELYRRQEKFGVAEELYIKALLVLDEMFGKDHPASENVTHNYICCISQALHSGQAYLLSDNEMTQGVLSILQSEL